MNELFYWKCEKCGIFHVVGHGNGGSHDASVNLKLARIQADTHDKEVHEKKPLTNFGVEQFNFELGID